jgi:DNA polymerase III delta prime subunit
LSSSTASKLDALIGLDSAKRVIREIVSGRAGVHSVLLYGAPGSGKNALADALAQAWLCRTPADGGACGECRACGAFERGTSADFLLVAPTGPSGIIKVEAVTNEKPTADEPTPILSFFRTTPLAARHKVALIESADRMNGHANNALLKTLEEPHPHAKLILTTQAVGALPATILSRCLAVACEAPSHDLLRGLFGGATEEELRLAEGTPGRLRQILAHRTAYSRIVDVARELLHRRSGEALVASDAIRQAAEGLEKALGCGARAANVETLELLAIFFAREPSAPPHWTQAIAESHRRMLQNGQPGLVFDALMAHLLAGR